MAEVTLVREYLEDAEGRWFAVLDGAQFDDLPAMLFDGDFVHKSLYLDRSNGSRERTLTAPQFVWLDHDVNTSPPPSDGTSSSVDVDVLKRLIAIIDDRHGAVFWECQDGGEVLYRHLRTINMVLFPKDADFDPGENYEADPLKTEDDKNESAARTESTHEMTLFRHADSNVMAQILPALDRPQLARLFGPATTILFVPDEDWGEGIQRALRPKNLPRPPSGPLCFTSETISAISRKRYERSQKKIASYLRDVAPDQTGDLSDQSLMKIVGRSDETAAELGIRTERGRGRFAYLMLLTDGSAGNSPDVRHVITNGERPPDTQVQRLVSKSATMLRSKG